VLYDSSDRRRSLFDLIYPRKSRVRTHISFLRQINSNPYLICLSTCLSPRQASGSLYAIPRDLPSALENALRGLEINELYSHQIEALDCLRKGCDLSIVTPTASGKTLCYNLAILEDCLNRPQTYALYIFPLKALAFDQFRLPPTYCRNISPRTACKSKTNDRRYST